VTITAGSRLGPYEILAPLGAGGMGEVWRARDTKLGREVALKVLPAAVAQDAERLARFEREAQVLASLNHPHIAAIHGVEDSTDTKALVLELVEGPTLQDRIAQGPLPVDEAVGIARQIADALEAAHEKGIVHRDLKPANVKLTADGNVKVLDFGLAKALDPAATSSMSPSASPTLMNSPTLTAAGTQLGVILGTAAYMAPEQARGGAVDKRADIFAFGAVVYEMLTGKRLFEGETASDTLAAVLRAEVDWGALPAATPPALRTLLARCLEKDRRKRLHDIGDAQFELDAAGRPLPATPAPRVRVRAWGGWLVAAALAAALAAVLFLSRAQRPTATPLTRLPVGLPSGYELVLDTQVAVALSSDGRKLALTVRDKASQKLLLRDLGELETRIVEGSEGAQHPFFSPDGEWLAFFAGNQLVKVPVAGGPPVTLASATGQNRGATFCPDGSVVMSPNSAVGLQRLPANGGAPVELTKLDAGRQERTHRWPAALPDGRGVVFTSDTVASSEFYDDARIEAVDFKTGERKTLVEGSSRALAMGDHLFFARGGAVYAVNFDADRLTVSGAPQPVLRGVATDVSTGAAHFDIARDGTLLYVPGLSTASASTAEWVDVADGAVTASEVPAGVWDQLALSPDGSRVALAGSPGATSDIWVANLERATLNRLTFEGVASDPAWSPDGTRIAYSLRIAEQPAKIYLKPSDGSGAAELLYEESRMAFPRAFSPDGRYLVLDQAQARGASDLFVLPLAGDRTPFAFVESPFDEYTAVFSPDGRYVSYNSDESGINEVYVRPFPRGDGRWQISIGGGTESRWSRDGSEILYRNQGTLMRVKVDTRAGFVSSRPEQVASGMLTGGNPKTFDVAPDGRRVLRLLRGSHGSDLSTAALVLGWSAEVSRLMSAKTP
jgi:eukaryotic-like serine/threonine-protein kinase